MIEYMHEIIVLVTAVVFTFVGHILTAYVKREPFIGQTTIQHGIKAPKDEPKRDEHSTLPKWADS